MRTIKPCCICLAVLAATITALRGQVITVPQLSPYTSDANTMLLQHFDGTTDGSVSGSVTYSNAVFGQGARLNASSYIAYSMGALSQGTVEFWAKIETLTNNGCGFVFASLSANQWSTMWTGLGYTNHPGAMYNDNNNVWQGMGTSNTYSATITANSWHHYATTWGSKGFHVYLDGELIYSNSVTGGLYPGTSSWQVGANLATGNIGSGFNGVIDELRISNVQRDFTPAPSQIVLVKAFTLDFQNLLVGSNYQAQASADLVSWTNWGAAFTATSSIYTGTNYQRVANWNQLFFRLQLQ